MTQRARTVFKTKQCVAEDLTGLGDGKRWAVILLPSNLATLAVLENHVDLLRVRVIDDLLEGHDVRVVQLLQDGDLFAHLIFRNELCAFPSTPSEWWQTLLAVPVNNLDGVKRAFSGSQVVLQLVLRRINRHVAAQANASVRSVTNLVENLG